MGGERNQKGFFAFVVLAQLTLLHHQHAKQLIEAIKSAKFPHDRYQTTTIVNTDDAIPGSGMFVRSSLESNKKRYPWSQFIVDSDGVARSAWQLNEGSSAIVVLDKDGRVRWAKDGALTQQEVQQVMDLLHKLLT